MSPFLIGMIVGVFLGAMIGYFTAALMVVARDRRNDGFRDWLDDVRERDPRRRR